MKTFLKKYGAVALLLVAGVVLLVTAPSMSPAKATTASCPNPPTTPTFNPYPVSNNGENCTDYPLVSARVINGGTYGSQVSANTGDELWVMVYVHNGAADNLSDSQTMAHDVKVATQVSGLNTSTTTISATASGKKPDGSAMNSISNSAKVSIPANTHMEIVPNSGEIANHDDNVLQSGLTVTNTTTSLGDMKACYPYLRKIYFKLRVVSNATPTPTPAKTPTPTPVKTPTPTPTVTGSFACTPSNQTANVNQNVSFQVTNVGIVGPNGPTWSAPGGTPATGSSVNFTTKFSTHGTKTVTAYETYHSVTCTVTVLAPSPTPTPTLTPTPTPTSTPTPTPCIFAGRSNCATPTPTPTPTPTQTPTPTAIIHLTKLVRNVTQNSGETDTVSARPFDVVEFVIRVRNDGNGDARNVRMTDDLPGGLTYQSGDALSSNLGTLTPGEQVSIRFRVTVREDGYFSYGTTTLTNIAAATSDNAGSDRDEAYVRVTRDQVNTLLCTPSSQNVDVNQYANMSANGGNGVYSWSVFNGNPSTGNGSHFSTRFNNNGTYTVGLSDTAGHYTTCAVYVNNYNNQSSISIDKLVRNITSDTGEQNTVSAHVNDTVQFILRVTINSNNGTIQNLRVSDALPYGLQYINGTTQIDNANYVGYNDNITTSGINLGTYHDNRTITIKFQARVLDFNGNYQSYTNVAYANADNIGTVNDTAYVNATKDYTVINPNYLLSIQKLGRNISKGEINEQTHVNAAPGDTIDFLIHVRSLSSTVINNVIVRDALPSGLQYINQTTSLNNNIVSDGIVDGGINIGSLSPNQEAIVRFSAVVRDASYFSHGIIPLTNIAYTRGDNVPEISAQLPLSIYNGSVLGAVGGVQTGAAGMAAITIALSAIMALGYMAYSNTGLFRKREARSVINQSRSNKNKFNFAR